MTKLQSFKCVRTGGPRLEPQTGVLFTNATIAVCRMGVLGSVSCVPAGCHHSCRDWSLVSHCVLVALCYSVIVLVMLSEFLDSSSPLTRPYCITHKALNERGNVHG